jgi:leader peptidase (prepilin peptidase)/N-methyltransferase
MKILMGIYLLVNTWTDIRRKEIDIRYTWIICVLLAGYFSVSGDDVNWAGMLPGLGLWAAAHWKTDKVGEGDGIVSAVLGITMQTEMIWAILAESFLLAGGVAVFLVAVGKRKEFEIPFVPFILAGYILKVMSTGWLSHVS